MAATIVLIEAPTAGAPLSTNDYNAQNTLIQALLCKYMSDVLHLTEWDTLVEPELLESICIQHGGALFQVQGDNFPITDPGGLANGRIYIKVERSGDSLTAEFTDSAAGYEWNAVYNGFYHADGSQLLPYVLYLTASGYHKYVLKDSENPYDITALIRIRQKQNIGAWDMSSSNVINISFDDILVQLNIDLSTDDFSDVVFIEKVNIIRDDGSQIDNLDGGDHGYHLIDMNNDRFQVWADWGAGFFNTVNYNDGAMNRGHIFYLCFI